MKPKYQPMLEGFMKGTGSGRLFVYYQPGYRVLDSGEIQIVGGYNEFHITDGTFFRFEL